MQIGGSASYANLAKIGSALQQSSERISSGKRINSASDDAAGLAIANRQTSQIRGYSQSIRNASDGVSQLQTKSASLEGINSGVERLRELALQAGNGTLNSADRGALNKEAQQLVSEINQTVQNSQFNGKSLLSGEGDTELQVGPNSDDQLRLEQNDFSQSLKDSGFNAIDFSTAEGAQAAIGVLDQVAGDINSENANIGAGINRLNSSINNLANSELNAQESRSRIQDADFAKEVTELVNNRVKEDAAIAMAVYSNQDRSSVLKFLQQ